MTRVAALSISQPVWDSLQAPPCTGRVAAVFRQACIVQCPDGHLLALVLPQVGNGPLNIVLDARPDDLGRVRVGMAVSLEASRLQAGALRVHLQGAAHWAARPAWERLRCRREAIQAQLPFLRAQAFQESSSSSLLALLIPQAPDAAAGPDRKEGVQAPDGVVLDCARKAALALRAGWPDDLTKVGAAAANLAGLGPGLTPAGDDLLMGIMLWTWLAQETPHPLNQAMLESAVWRTTRLSASLLQAAANGACSAAWHNLLDALFDGNEEHVTTACRSVLAHGHSSGGDSLAGFLWPGLAAVPDPAPRGARTHEPPQPAAYSPSPFAWSAR